MQMRIPSCLHNRNVSFSSSLCYSPPLPFKISTLTLPQTLYFQRLSLSCSISKIHCNGTVELERRRWSDIYRRISFMENPELGSASVLNQLENEGKNLTKWELCRVVKELRKYKKHKRALEVYDWMNNREERFISSASDAAIQLDLIAKVDGVSSAEEFFMGLTDKLKERRTYAALLNAYVHSRMKEKAESLLDIMRSKGYATHSLPFNVMMTLYMNLKEYDKVYLLVSEMIGRNIQLDIYSYNIWLSSCGSQGLTEKMEQVFEQMTKDSTIVPNWTTFSTMATIYIKMGNSEKAEECLRKFESSIKGRNRIPYHHLLSLYGNVGKKEEVYRVWNIYKSCFPSIPNLGYYAIISSLVRIGDIEGAENIYEEWLLVTSCYNPSIGNLLIGYYVQKGITDKALGFFKHMIEAGGIPNSSTWEILAGGHIEAKRISEALSCLKEAFMSDGTRSWRPKPRNLCAFFKLCEDKNDVASIEILIGLLRQSKCLQDKNYASLIGLSGGALCDGELSSKSDTTD